MKKIYFLFLFSLLFLAVRNGYTAQEQGIAVTFDTLEFKNTLLAGNVPETQADAQVKAISKALSTNIKDLATKGDLNNLESRLETKLTKLELALIDRMAKQFYWILGLLIPMFLSIIGLVILIVLKR